MFKGISRDDQKFLNLMFNRRHLLAHKNGVVDQQYLRNTDDTSVRLNEKIRIRSKHIRRLIPLVRALSDNLINDFESMFPIERQSTSEGKRLQAICQDSYRNSNSGWDDSTGYGSRFRRRRRRS